tara:strand:- start:32 stop:259 length:228 start_codon:yes stop_codon:yes gene_type:complete
VALIQTHQKPEEAAVAERGLKAQAHREVLERMASVAGAVVVCTTARQMEETVVTEELLLEHQLMRLFLFHLELIQ